MDIKEVLNGNIFKVWAKFIIASVVGVVLNTIYTMVDGIFIGQGVGEVGLAGVNIAWPAVTLVVGIGLMIGIGTSSIIAIYMGKGENNRKALQMTPTADVQEVRHGKWISNDLGGYKWAYYCSECGWVDGYPFNDRHKYCPHCGAKMDGEREMDTNKG